MIDELTIKSIECLIKAMGAVTPDGEIDHKTRMQAVKEARALTAVILPKMTAADRETFSSKMNEELSSRLAAIKQEEKTLAEIAEPIDPKTPGYEEAKNLVVEQAEKNMTLASILKKAKENGQTHINIPFAEPEKELSTAEKQVEANLRNATSSNDD